MTTIARDPVMTPVFVGTEFDAVAETIIEAENESERGERDSMRDDRAAMRTAGEARVGAMREAADQRLVAGIASASAQAASAVSSAVGTGVASARANGEAHLGSSSPSADGEPATRSADFGDYAPSVSKGLEAAGSGLSTLMSHLASEADERGERARMSEDEARSRADEARGNADAARSSADKREDLYASIVSEKRRSEEAASRA